MKRYKKLFLVLSAVIVVTAFYLLFFNKETVKVSKMNIYKGSVTRTIDVSGTIISGNVEVIPLESNINVTKVYVKENDYVEKNQILAELDAEQLSISLEKAKLNLDELVAKLSNISGDNSKTILSANALSRNMENYTKISKDLQAAKEELKKAETFFNENIISKAEYDKYEEQVNNINSMIKTAELNLSDTNINYRENQEQKSQDILSIERQIKSVNLDIESLIKKINDSIIYSSTNGVITEFPIEENRKILSGEKIVIHSTENYEFISKVAQKDAVLIREGQKSIIKVDGLSSAYEGVVTQISKTAQMDNSGSK